MVSIGDSAGHGIANNLREIESGVPGIGSRDEQPAYGVERPRGEFPFSALVIPRILTEDAGEDSGRHVGPDAIVGEGGSVAFPISSPSLPPGFRGIVRLANRGQRTDKRVGEIVEHSGGCQFELLSGGEPGNYFGTFYGSVVRHHLEDAVVRGSCLLLQLALFLLFTLLLLFRVRAIFALGCLLARWRRGSGLLPVGGRRSGQNAKKDRDHQ